MKRLVLLSIWIPKCYGVIIKGWNEMKETISERKIENKRDYSSYNSKLDNICYIFEKLLSPHVVAGCKNNQRKENKEKYLITPGNEP